MYVVELHIDQRPPQIDVVSEGVYNVMCRLGWFEDGRARLIT